MRLPRVAVGVLGLLACGRPAEPVLEPSGVEEPPEGDLVAVAEDGDGAVWVLADHGDETGALLRLSADRSEVSAQLDLDLAPEDLAWFVGGWVVVGRRGEDAAFRRVDPDGAIPDGGEPFAGRLLAVEADDEHAVMVGEQAGRAVGIDIDTTGAFQDTWSDLQGVVATEVALLADETYIATEQDVGGTQVLRRGPDGDARTQISLIASTLTPLTSGPVYIGGSTVPPSTRLPAYAWLGADLGVSEIVLPARGGEGRVPASAAWPTGGVVRVERGGVEREPDEVVAALVRPSSSEQGPSRWAQPLGGGERVRVGDLKVVGDRVLVVGSVDGRSAWWEFRPVE